MAISPQFAIDYKTFQYQKTQTSAFSDCILNRDRRWFHLCNQIVKNRAGVWVNLMKANPCENFYLNLFSRVSELMMSAKESRTSYSSSWCATKKSLVRGVPQGTLLRMAQLLIINNVIAARLAVGSLLPTTLIAAVSRQFANWCCRWRWMLLAFVTFQECCKSAPTRSWPSSRPRLKR